MAMSSGAQGGRGRCWGGMGVTHPTLLLQLLLLDLLVVGDNLPDAIDEATLVVGDEAHEDLLLGRVQEHEHTHLTRGCVGKVHAARLVGGESEPVILWRKSHPTPLSHRRF